jgi:hypothetical protein
MEVTTPCVVRPSVRNLSIVDRGAEMANTPSTKKEVTQVAATTFQGLMEVNHLKTRVEYHQSLRPSSASALTGCS